MSEAIISAITLVGIIGLASGLLLAIASTVMAVKVNEKEIAVRDCLPGANCGACGYSGCDAYAKAIAEDPTIPANLCRPGGAEAAKNIGAVLGIEVAEAKPMVAYVHCHGDCSAHTKKDIYSGIKSCAAAKMLYGGSGSCTFGCLGCGDCVSACEYDAICVVDGVAHVDPRKCIGCGMCAKNCPNHIISVIPKSAQPAVACSNKEKGAVTRKECTNGCIGCMKCQKNCPEGAITVVDNLATIDYDKCTGCGTCIEGCPVHCIDLRNL